jgi:membrane-bound ClpP family serine protease
MLTGLGSLLSGMAVLYQKVFSNFSMNKNPLLVLTAMLVTATIQFVLMGLLAEILIRTYHESQNRPTYVIKDIIESPGQPAGDSGDEK